MKIVNGNELTIEDVCDVAYKNEEVALPQDEKFWDTLKKSRKFLEDYIATGVPTYGVTTDFGDSCHNQISVDKAGELQRVMICRALAQQPETIILDEPTNHLDIRYKLELMKTLQAFGGLVIMTLHDLNLAAGFCDVIFVLKDGQIIAKGAPEEIFTRELLRDVFGTDIALHSAEGRIYIGV